MLSRVIQIPSVRPGIRLCQLGDRKARSTGSWGYGTGELGLNMLEQGRSDASRGPRDGSVRRKNSIREVNSMRVYQSPRGKGESKRKRQEENQWLWEVKHCNSIFLATHKHKPLGPIHCSPVSSSTPLLFSFAPATHTYLPTTFPLPSGMPDPWKTALNFSPPCGNLTLLIMPPTL